MKVFGTTALKNWYTLLVKKTKKTPLFLITITTQGVTQRFNTSKKNIDFPSSGGNTYSGGAIGLSNFSYSSDLTPDTLDVLLLNTNSQFSSYLLANKIGVTQVTILKVFNEDLSTGTSFQFFTGRVQNIATDSNSIALNCESYISLLRNNFLRVSTKTTCNHVLYSPACGLSEGGSFNGFNFSYSTTIASIDEDTNSLTLTSIDGGGGGGDYDDDYFTDGSIRLTKNGYTQRIHILDFTASTSTVLMMDNFVGAEVGDTVTLVAGCDFVHTICSSRFDNLDRFLGMPLIPRRNPSVDGARNSSAEGDQ